MFSVLIFAPFLIRSFASYETDSEEDARKNSEGNQWQVHRLTNLSATSVAASNLKIRAGEPNCQREG
jgi:hypothetical protein